MRRAQTEMLGLVFVVILVVVGMVLYAGLASRSSPAPSIDSALTKQEVVSFLTALTYADTSCKVSVGQVAIACQEHTPAGSCSEDSCAVLDRILERAGEQLLQPAGLWYNLSLAGTSAMAVYECESASRDTQVAIDQPIPIGTEGKPLRLAICSATHKKLIRS